ncbi:unnamed protein product [Polarella glacialis]|uniref:JmjC domain-containing protein n=2 Tax=Polarella glacialis TaxID=89957 RepID=A0A813FU18_POLGL|nr:unnamed protein product [Polarella glacialis]
MLELFELCSGAWSHLLSLSIGIFQKLSPRTCTSPSLQSCPDAMRDRQELTSRQLHLDSQAASCDPAPADDSKGFSQPPKEGESSDPARYSSRRTASEIHRCRKGQRTDIKPSEWNKFGYASRDDEVLSKDNIVYDEQTVPIPRVRRCDITLEEFQKEYVEKDRPVIVEGACSDWPAMSRWSTEALDERFRHVDFKVGKTDKGKNINLKMKYFLDYMKHQQDDNPLYLFETKVDENNTMRHLLDDFDHPDLFPHDWFGLMNDEARPPHRWWAIGPKRSGTTVHTDPLGTSAWNAVSHGVKRWVLFEPHVPKRIVKGRDVKKKGEDTEAIMYFDFLLPRLKKANPEVRVYEGLQNPGDIIFVPGDWWHGVLNLEDCVAVTANFCGPESFDKIWKRTRKDREKVAHLWLRNMKKFAPRLYARATELNQADGFRMRHQRGPGEKPDGSDDSSSDSSSSDSSSDSAEDLSPEGLSAALGGDVVLGHAAKKRRAEAAEPLPRRRRRETEDNPSPEAQ